MFFSPSQTTLYGWEARGIARNRRRWRSVRFTNERLGPLSGENKVEKERTRKTSGCGERRGYPTKGEHGGTRGDRACPTLADPLSPYQGSCRVSHLPLLSYRHVHRHRRRRRRESGVPTRAFARAHMCICKWVCCSWPRRYPCLRSDEKCSILSTWKKEREIGWPVRVTWLEGEAQEGTSYVSEMHARARRCDGGHACSGKRDPVGREVREDERRDEGERGETSPQGP